MPDSGPDQLQLQISKGIIRNLYLFQGPEEWLKEKALEGIKSTLFREGGAELNSSTVDGTETPGGEILMLAQTAPFLALRRLVIVKNAEEMPIAEEKTLAEGLPNLPSFSCLILMHQGKASRKNPVPARIPEGQIITFWPPFPSQLPSWISREAARQGKNIDTEAARQLSELFPSSLQDLSSEIDKLVLYVHDSPRIRLSDVQDLAGSGGTATQWELDSCLQERDIKGALLKVRALLKQGRSPESILPVLHKTLKTLLLAKVMEEQGTPVGELLKHFGIRGKTREGHFAKGVRLYNRGELERSLLRLERCEWDVKTGALEGETALTILLLKLSARQGVNQL